MSSIRRRDFLKGALAASAVGVAPFNILKAGPSPNSKLNIACIGVGGMGSSDASYLASSDNVIALCDVDEARHKRCIAGKKNLHGIKFWKDYRVMFDKIGKEIDAIHTATPDHARFAVSMFAMRRGKHVYAQKPLCHTVNEARVLTEEARKRRAGNDPRNRVMASKGEDKAMSGLDYAGPLSEVIVLGDVAMMHPGKKQLQDAKNMKITNSDKANKSFFMKRLAPRDDMNWI